MEFIDYKNIKHIELKKNILFLESTDSILKQHGD